MTSKKSLLVIPSVLLFFLPACDIQKTNSIFIFPYPKSSYFPLSGSSLITIAQVVGAKAKYRCAKNLSPVLIFFVCLKYWKKGWKFPKLCSLNSCFLAFFPKKFFLIIQKKPMIFHRRNFPSSPPTVNVYKTSSDLSHWSLMASRKKRIWEVIHAYEWFIFKKVKSNYKNIGLSKNWNVTIFASS